MLSRGVATVNLYPPPPRFSRHYQTLFAALAVQLVCCFLLTKLMLLRCYTVQSHGMKVVVGLVGSIKKIY